MPWQVVGYVERCTVNTNPDEEQEFWREYLLYRRNEGFAFLVDAEDGWSWVRTITGVPQRVSGQTVTYNGVTYKRLYAYVGKVTYVVGEFYWRLQRDERTLNTDYQGTGAQASRRLNQEQTQGEAGAEIVWSVGETLTAEAVVRAFALPRNVLAGLQRDATPLSISRIFGSGGIIRFVVWFVLLLILILVLQRCETRRCDDVRATFGASSYEYQQCLNSSSSGSSYRGYGGSYGGYSSGGGHK